LERLTNTKQPKSQLYSSCFDYMLADIRHPQSRRATAAKSPAERISSCKIWLRQEQVQAGESVEQLAAAAAGHARNAPDNICQAVHVVQCYVGYVMF
jgi:hypothetical protein